MKVVSGALAADFFDSGMDDFPFKIPFKKCFKIVDFPLWHRDPSGFGAAKSLQFVRVVVRNSIAFCNSVSADRSGMAASRFLAAAAASKILLCFAALHLRISKSRDSHCNGCVKIV